jgi:thioredoxin reductase
MIQFEKLFSPIRLGSLELKNRFVVPPMASNLAYEDGTVTKAIEFLEDGALVSKNGKTLRFEGFDAVVLALGARSVNSLKEELKERVPEIYIIGDALAPRQAIDAIEEGARIALKI